MKVTVIKSFVNKYGMTILKGRKVEASEELEAMGVIESLKPVTEKKAKKADK